MRPLWYLVTFPGQIARLLTLAGGSGTWSVLGEPFGVVMSSAAFYLIAYLLFFAPGS